MVNCVIISAGEKIKNLREKYKVKQEDIAGSDITRNLISEIEHNKVKVTINTAEVILRHLNKLAAERGFNVEETVDYLVEDELSQASNILDEFIEELKTLSVYKDDSFINTLNEAENFLINWDIKDKKTAIYELAGDYFCTKNDMYKSVVYYEKALTLIGKYSIGEGLLSLLRKLSMVYEYVEKYNESIDCCNLALTHFSDLSNNYKFIFLYNSALSYEKLNNFDKALNKLREAEIIVDITNTSRMFKVLDERAICLKKLGHYHEAISIYNKILDMLNDSDLDKKVVVYINAINVYMKLQDNSKVIEKLQFVLNSLSDIGHSNYIDDIYFEVGLIYEYLDNLEEAYKNCLKAINFAKKQKNYALVKKILESIINFVTIINDEKRMDYIVKEVFQISNKQEKLSYKLMFKLIDFYSSNNDMEKIKEINKFALQFEK